MRREAGRSLDAAVVVENAGIVTRIASLRLGGLSDGAEAAGALAEDLRACGRRMLC